MPFADDDTLSQSNPPPADDDLYAPFRGANGMGAPVVGAKLDVGRETWGDVYQAGAAALHGLGATGAGAMASVSSDPTVESRWQGIATGQETAQQQDLAARTPAGQDTDDESFYQHPMSWLAGQAPGFIAYGAPAIAAAGIGGPAAGAAVMSGMMGMGTRGDVYNRLTGQGIKPTTEQLAGATAIGAATGALTGAAPGLMGKLATSPLVDMALKGGVSAGADAVTMGAGAAGQEALTQKAEIGAGKRDQYDPSAIAGAGVSGAEFGAALGAAGALAGHGDGQIAIHRGAEEGQSGTSVRSPRDYRKPEVTTQGGKSSPEAPTPTEARPPPPASPVDDPAVKAATGVTPPELPPASPPEVIKGDPTPEPPPPEPAPEETPPPEQITPQPTPESDASLQEQHAALIDPSNSREAMLYPQGVDPISITERKARYGQTELADGRTVQFDRRGPSNLTGAKIQNADRADQLNQLLKLGDVSQTEAAQRAVAGEPPAAVVERTPEGVEAKAAAGTTVTAPDQVAALEATKTPGNVVNVEPVQRVLDDRAQSRVVEDQQRQLAQASREPVTQAELPRGRILPAAQTEEQRVALGEAAAEQIRRTQENLKQMAQAEQPRPVGKHWTKGELAKLENNNQAAREIADRYQADADKPQTPNTIYARAKAMVDEAKSTGVRMPDEYGEGTKHGPGPFILSAARDLVSKQYPKPGDYGRFLEREYLARQEGGFGEAIAARRQEGAESGALGSPTEAEAPRATQVEMEPSPEDRLIQQEEERERERAYTTPPTERKAPVVQTLKSRRRALEIPEDDRGGGGDGRMIITADPQGNPIGVTSRRSITGSDLLREQFDPKNYSAELRPMMERLRDAVERQAGDIPVHFISHEDMRQLGRPAYGMYDHVDDHVFMNAEKQRYDTAIHEMFHAATSRALDADPRLKALMENLRTEVAVKLPELAPGEFKKLGYAFSDPEEFLTHLMTNRDVQRLLQRVRISAGLANEIGIPKWRKMTMWEGAMSLMRRALGLGPRDTSAIEAAMSISEQAMWKRDPGMAMEAMSRAPRFHRQAMDASSLGEMSDEPEEAGRSINRSMKQFQDKLGNVAKDMVADRGAGLVKAGNRLASEPQLYDMHAHLFKSEGADPMRDRLDAMQRRGPRAEELAKDGHELSGFLRELASKHGNDAMAKLEQVKKLSNEFGVWPHHELGEGKNSHLKGDVMSNWEARAHHEEVANLYHSLPEDLQEHYLEEAQAYTDRYNMLAKQRAQNYIEGVEPPQGSTVPEMVEKMHKGLLSESDIEHYASKGIKNLEVDDFQKRKAPYFPAERVGDFVVQGEHAIPTPKGSDTEADGTALDPNVRRFDTEQEAKNYVGKLDLPSNVSTRYYLEDAQGNRHNTVTEDGVTRRVTSEDTGGNIPPGWSNKKDYRVRVQNQHVAFAESYSDAQRVREDMQKGGVQNVSNVQDRRGRGVDASMTSPQTRALLANIDRRTDLTDLQKDQLKDSIKETAVVLQSGSRIMKNMIRTQRVQGAQYRTEAVQRYFDNSSRHLAAMEFAPKIDKAFEDMHAITKERRGDDDAYNRSVIMNEMEGRSFNAKPENMYGQSSPLVKKMMNVAYVTDMASASHLLTHQLNLHYMGGSVIGARHGVFQTLRMFNNIMREAGGPWMAIKHGFGSALQHFKDPEQTGVSMFNMMRNSIKNARERAVVDDLVATGHIHDHSGLDTSNIKDTRTWIGKVSRFIQDSSGSMDSMGRFVTGLAAYRMEYAKTGNHEKALLYARQSIEKGLTHYGVGMRAPAFSGPITRMLTQFRLPGMNMLYLLGRNAYLTFRHSDIQTRNEAFRTLGAMMIGGWALSGSSALPTEPLKLLGILGNQLGVTPAPSTISDELQRGLASTLGSTAADVIMDGPLSLMGPFAPSFAHRVASPELSYGEPASGKVDDLQSWLAGMMFGAAGNYGVNVLRGSQAAMSGDFPSMIQYLAPKQLADAAKAYKLYEKGEPGAAPEALMQMFGVRSQDVVRQQEGESALYNRLQADKTAKSAAMKGGPAAVLKWNAANPTNKITQAELRQSRSTSASVLGLKVPKAQKALADEYQRTYGQ